MTINKPQRGCLHLKMKKEEQKTGNERNECKVLSKPVWRSVEGERSLLCCELKAQDLSRVLSFCFINLVQASAAPGGWLARAGLWTATRQTWLGPGKSS